MPSSPLPAWLTRSGVPLAPAQRTTPDALVGGLASPIAPELVAWAELVAGHAIPGERHFRVARPEPRGLEGLLADPHALFTLLVGAVPIAWDHGGHLHFVASPHATPDGGARVYAYSDDDDALVQSRAPSIAHLVHETWQNAPDDPAVAQALAGVAGSEGGGTWDGFAKLPKLHDPEALFARARWVTTALDRDLWNDADLAPLLEAAPKKPLVPFDAVDAAAPAHVAAHALFAAYLLAHDAALAGLAAGLAAHAPPFVRDLALAVGSLAAGGEAPAAIAEVDLGPLAEARARALAASPAAAKRAARSGPAKARPAATPLERLRAWVKRPTAPAPDELEPFLDSDQPEVDAFVLDGLATTSSPDVAGALAIAAMDRGLVAAAASLRRLVEARVGFSHPSAGWQAPMNGPRCVRALAVLEGPSCVDFVRRALEVTAGTFAEQDAHRWHHYAALVPAVLVHEPADAPALGIARTVLARCTYGIEGGVLERVFPPSDALCLLWAIERARLVALHDALRPLATFRLHPRWEGHPERAHWELVREWAAELVGG